MERWNAALQTLIDGEQFGYTRRRRQGVSGDIKDTVAEGRKARGGRADDDDDYEVCVCACVCACMCACVRACVRVCARARMCVSQSLSSTHLLTETCSVLSWRAVRRLDARCGCQGEARPAQ